jgi:murein DD-endopeptidase MepM/ murein hydrolase activator NlpD
VDFFGRQVENHRIAELEGENFFLSNRIELINHSIDSLRGEIVALTEKEQAIRTIFDLPMIDPQERQLGIGGPELMPDDQTYTSTQLSAYQAEAQIDRLLALSDFEKRQFSDIYDALTEKRTTLDHTPSIMPTTGWMIRGYGIKRDPFTGKKRLHAGLDISNKRGTPIVAAANGRVIFTGNRGPLGKTVVIDHGNGFETLYGHVDKFEVKKGQTVKRGDLIALMGNTGYSTGPHLHYGIMKNGASVNPKKYIYSSDYLLAN